MPIKMDDVIRAARFLRVGEFFLELLEGRWTQGLDVKAGAVFAEVLQEAVVEGEIEAIEELGRPTAATTADEMARARPDLLTGELKLPRKD